MPDAFSIGHGLTTMAAAPSLQAIVVRYSAYHDSLAKNKVDY